MVKSWLKLLASVMVCASLVLAPCNGCQPKQEKAHCGHDCCPKPRPAKSCSWQPADYDSTGAKQEVHVAAPAAPATVLVVLRPAALAAEPAIPVVQYASPPPLYLTQAALLI